jgi:hypothetical protein
MEHWTADSRGRAAGPHGQTRHADDGRRPDRRRRDCLHFAVGQALECLRLDGCYRDIAFRRHRFCRRLSQDGQT